MKISNLILAFALTFCGALLANDIETFTVNGLKVIVKQNEATDIIAAQMYYRGGCTILKSEQAGIENLALTVAQKATLNYPKDELNAALESMDTRLSSSVNRDFSSLNLQCVRQNFVKSWEIFVDVILNPVIAPEDVELERQRLISGIKQRQDNPDAYLQDIQRKTYFLDHPYSVDEGGTPETLSSFDAEDLESFLQRRTTGKQMLLVVVGDVVSAELEKMVEKSFGKLEAGEFNYQLPPEVTQAEPSVQVVNRELPTNYILGNCPAPRFCEDERYAMVFATSVLNDRLFEEVRTKRGLSYAPAAGTSSSFANYSWIYVTAVDPDTTIKVMRQEVEKMINEGISGEELRNKVNVFITQYYLGKETNRGQGDALARYELCGSGYEKSANFIPGIKGVTSESIKEVLRKYMNNMHFVLIGNPKTLDVEAFMF